MSKSNDLISRQAATSIPILPKEHWKKFKSIDDAFETGWNEALSCVNMLPSAQPEQPTGVQDILQYLDEYLHPIVSPEHWSVYSELHDMISMLPSAQQWIPCSEQLPPEENKTYWVCTDNGHQHECRWTNANTIWTHLTTDWHWNIFDIPQYTKVVAWMELPKPYDGGE